MAAAAIFFSIKRGGNTNVCPGGRHHRSAIYVAVDCSELYRQDRVRIHIQFFLSLLFLSVVSIAWYLLVHYELLSNPIATESVVYRNPVTVLSQLTLTVTETKIVTNI